MHLLIIKKERGDLEKLVSKWWCKSPVFIFMLLCLHSVAQEAPKDSTQMFPLNFQAPGEFTIAGISVSGSNYYDPNVLSLISGLSRGQTITIPGDEIRMAAEKLWGQKLFSDVEIYATKTEGSRIFLEIRVVERPRLSGIIFDSGLRKGKQKALREELTLKKGDIITENLSNKTRREIRAYYWEKGFYNLETTFSYRADTTNPNYKYMVIELDRGKRVKVNDYVFSGNDSIPDNKLRRLLKPKRKRWKLNVFASSKFIESTYEETKPELLKLYRTQGYRDAYIISDSVKQISEKRVNVYIDIHEGKKYFFRDIEFTGNSKYSDGFLDTLLNIKKGEVFDQSKLETRLYMNPVGRDVSSLYMDDGYLFFNVTPIETQVVNDSIDLEIRIYEGKQATISKVTVVGNDKTSDHVILRTLRTKPGQKFSRSDIQRSMRELSQLPYFDPQALDVKPQPNPASGTVDLEYVVAEKASDQIEASGGWGGNTNFVGTVGLRLNNFSTRRMFEKGGWNPMPTGDGQQLSIRAQSNGTFYQSYNFSFTEPWLGGTKPNSLSFSVYYTKFSSINQQGTLGNLHTTGTTLAYGKLLKWPDDFFTITYSLNYLRYKIDNFDNYGVSEIGFSKGFANNINLGIDIARNSTDNPIFPQDGAQIRLEMAFTPPYSAFKQGVNFNTISAEDKFRFVEYYKWKFDARWYTRVFNDLKLILAPQFQFGYVGVYNKQIGYSPFEQYYMGGVPFGAFQVFGMDLVPLRGYDDGTISDPFRGSDPDPIFTRFSVELRYPVSLNPSATVWLLGFADAGNAWDQPRNLNPFGLKRSAGIGVRFFLPMFGLLGFDYGWGFDKPDGVQQGKFHFMLGQQF